MLSVLDQPDFDVIVTGDDVESSKPSQDLLESVLGRAGLDPDELLVVGDSVWDMEAARRVGAPAVGVATGGTSAAELHEAGAEFTFSDLPALLNALQAARADSSSRA